MVSKMKEKSDSINIFFFQLASANLKLKKFEQQYSPLHLVRW
jgi:hypothetical protein